MFRFRSSYSILCDVPEECKGKEPLPVRLAAVVFRQLQAGGGFCFRCRLGLGRGLRLAGQQSGFGGPTRAFVVINVCMAPSSEMECIFCIFLFRVQKKSTGDALWSGKEAVLERGYACWEVLPFASASLLRAIRTRSVPRRMKPPAMMAMSLMTRRPAPDR